MNSTCSEAKTASETKKVCINVFATRKISLARLAFVEVPFDFDVEANLDWIVSRLEQKQIGEGDYEELSNETDIDGCNINRFVVPKDGDSPELVVSAM